MSCVCTQHRTPRPLRPWRTLALLALGGLLASSALRAASDLDAARDLFRRGEYEQAQTAAEAGCKASAFEEDWWRLDAEVLLTRGRYEDAHTALLQAGRYVTASIRLRLLMREACLYTHRDDEAQQAWQEINSIIAVRQRASRDPEFLATAGEAALLAGADPKLILENFLKPGEQASPPLRDAVLAAGRLALIKRDYALASRTFYDALKTFGDDPDMLAGMAAAFQEDDGEQLLGYAGKALAINPHHVASHLLLADHLIDAEQYDLAKDELDEVLSVNPLQPEALALLSVAAELRNQTGPAAEYRTKALSTWAKNPRVDYVIGNKLSRNYRFTEGAAALRRSLELDETYTPARIRLAQDLLRLGRDDEGWKVAADAHDADGYDVEAFNLVTLHDQLDKFTTVEDAHFKVRMGKDEAPVYGDRALALLERARDKLTAKYGLNLDKQVTVEIYPDPKDFAVRTFGMPDMGGFLGVCFGSVITVNSPATSSANWEAVLWHEFTHVITLTITRNRMPRWLSEGISVYEEWQANPGWGMLMSLSHRDRILEGKMQPISGMSAAFLQAKSPQDMQFAYFQSALVVKFLIDHYGLDHLKALLQALGADEDINEAFAKHFAPLDTLNTDFAAYAQTEAKKLGGNFDLTQPKDALGQAAAAIDPRNFHARVQQVGRLIADEKWTEARTALTELTAGGLYRSGAENPHLLLAKVCAKLNDSAGEKAAWATVAAHEGDALDPVTHLLTLAEAAHDPAETVRWGEAWLAINPLAPTPWRALLTAHESRSENAPAIQAAQVLLKLDPPDLASVHYRLARLLQPTDPAAARRHVLQALEEAPRFRAAYDLLSSLPAAPPVPDSTPAPTP